MGNFQVLCTECDTPVGDSIPLCDRCCDNFVDDLRAVPGIIVDLSVTSARLDRMSTGRNGGKSAEVPIPIRVDGGVTKAHDALVNSLTTWGRLLEDHYSETIPIGARGLVQIAMNIRAGGNSDTPRLDKAAVALTPVTAAEQVAVWLATNPALIRLMPASHEMITDLANAIAGAHMAVDRRPDLRYLGPCPNVVERKGNPIPCGFSLRAEADADWVRCRRCREQHEIKQLLKDARRRVEDRLCTMAQIKDYLRAMGYKIPTSTLHNWNNRPPRWLVKRGWLHGETITTHWINREDPPVYRLGDVLRMVERMPHVDMAKSVAAQRK